jgi:hypothetical protein
MAMTVVTAGPAKWTWSEDVLAFARQGGVEQCLDELMRATQAMFPGAREIRVSVARDPENSLYDGIKWTVCVSSEQVPDYLDATTRWHREFHRICPTAPTALPAFYQQIIREHS